MSQLVDEFLSMTMTSEKSIEQQETSWYRSTESLLFEGTVAENIALNDPQASTESIIEAAKLACS